MEEVVSDRYFTTPLVLSNSTNVEAQVDLREKGQGKFYVIF